MAVHSFALVQPGLMRARLTGARASELCWSACFWRLASTTIDAFSACLCVRLRLSVVCTGARRGFLQVRYKVYHPTNQSILGQVTGLKVKPKRTSN
jgi:hypothetical protein